MASKPMYTVLDQAGEPVCGDTNPAFLDELIAIAEQIDGQVILSDGRSVEVVFPKPDPTAAVPAETTNKENEQ